MTITAKTLEKWGIPWPTPVTDPTLGIPVGLRFSKVLSFSRNAQVQTIHYGPPLPPVRHIPCEYAMDDEGHEIPIEWRELTEEEWTTTRAAYEEALSKWRRTGGMHRIKAGPDIMAAEFVLEDGSVAEGRFEEGGRDWHWIAWRMP